MNIRAVPITWYRDHTWSLDDTNLVKAALGVFRAIANEDDRARATALINMLDAGFDTITRDIES